MQSKYIQEPPFCLQLELTEGCNLRCGFCGLQGIRAKGERNYKFMDQKTAEAIALSIQRNKWNCRLEFAMHGEPTLNPAREMIIHIFRTLLPKHSIMMTSNGGGIIGDPHRSIVGLFKAGLNTLLLDDYEHSGIVKTLISKYKESDHGDIEILSYPDDPDANPHKRCKPYEQRIVVVADISKETKGNHSVLNNHAGSAFPKNDNAAGRPCAKPFRELSIRWDGNVAICCNDWRGIHKIGNVLKSDLEEIWQHPQMQAARRKLLRGKRDFGACKGCDALSYRTGLLPDKMGNDYLDHPTEEDDLLLAEGCAGQSYSPIVPRDYERLPN